MTIDFGRALIRGGVIALALATGVTHASQEPPKAFDDAVLEQTVSISSPGKLVLFSPLRVVNNEIRSASMARLPVKGKGQRFRVLDGSSRAEAREHYRRELQSRGAQVLFECSGRDCGRSSAWANQVFNQSTLFGSDANQDYLIAGSVDEDGKPSLTLVYTITRGNQREYVWVEQLESPSGTTVPGLGTGSARIKGPIIVPWQGGITYSFDWSSTERRRINDWAGAEGAQVILVGYSELTDEETFEESMTRAEKAVESLSRVLASSGVSASRQERVITGPAVVIPNPERQGNRVEIIVIQR